MLVLQMETNKIKVIFFDIGGVLLSDGWDRHSRKKAALNFGFDYDEMDQLHQIHFPIYEIGSYSLSAYLDKTVFYTKRDFSKEEFQTFIMAQSQELPHTLTWLKVWNEKHKFRIFSINNEGKELHDYRTEQFRLHELFEGFITSGYVGLRKPDPKIYQLALNIVQAKPEQCIYFDDRDYLVKAARDMGINAFQHRSFENTKHILEQLQINH